MEKTRFLKTNFSLLLFFALSAIAPAVGATNSACLQVLTKNQVLDKTAGWMKAVSTTDLASRFNYSPSVLERIFKHQPKIHQEMVKVHLGKKSRYSSEDLTAVDLYRGLVSAPEDYDPLFNLNHFGGTRAGINWFSRDLSKSHSYATPTREQVKEKRYETKEAVVPMGLLIHFQIPKFIVEEANMSYNVNGKNLELDRKFLGNESPYIENVTIVNADFNINDYTEKELTYEDFLKNYRKKSKYKKSFIF